MPARSAELVPSSPKRRKAIDFKAQQQAQHTATISLIVKNTGKIQKEIGFRRARLKQVYQKCSEAINILNKFKDVSWPPNQPESGDNDDNGDAIAGNSSIDLASSNESDGVIVNKDDVSTDQNDDVSTIANDSEAEFTDVDTIAETEADEGEIEEKEESDEIPGIARVTTEEEAELSKERAIAEAEAIAMGEEDVKMTSSLDETMDINGVVSDDSHVQHPTVETDTRSESNDEKYKKMRKEVVAALNCYCLTITHPMATAKMIEIALECIGLLISNRYVSGTTIADEIVATEPDQEHADDFKKIPEIMRLINCICECADNASDAVQSAMCKDLLSLMTSPVCAVHESGMLKAVRTVFHIYLITKHEDVKKMSREVLLDMLRSVFQRMEAYDAMASSDSDEIESKGSFKLPDTPSNNKDEVENNGLFASRFHTDSYLLFRALCKLSAKPLPEDADDDASMSSGGNLRVFAGSNKVSSDPMATATKILSLELIVCVFEHCGDAFRTGEKFIYAIKNFLCVSLLKNCVSSNTKVAHISLKVFLFLVYKFKNHLKAEIEVFIANVFLPVLESPNCPVERKSLVLEALRALCADPVLLTSIFLNYDCDFDAVNLYKTIVQHLTSLSIKGRKTAPTPSNKQKPIQDNFSLGVAGLEVLVVILQGFLRALNLPGGDDIDTEERSKARGNLQLDVGMAAKTDKEVVKKSSSTADDMAVTAQEIEHMENSVAGKIVDAFDKKRLAQQNFELGCVKFKLSAKQGLLFFIQSGFLHMDAKEVAAFFYEHREVLDKTQIGEIFGREPEASFVKDADADPEKGGVGFYIRVLHHYVDNLNFTGLKFDDAIRLFLSGFRLPGESQKVDRIMEKFAEQYTIQNEDVFPTADVCFILAFAVIMLQTDLHNPNIKPEKKITKEGFINMNKGISVDGGDLPADFLSDIYISIKNRPFTLKEDEEARNYQKKADDNGFNEVFFTTAAEERRRERFKKERAELVESTEKLFKRQNSGDARESDFGSSVNPKDVVKPMFDITWGPLLGALSQILEKAEDETSIALCLNGFVYAVRIASHIHVELARSTFVNSLAKFTALGSIKELKPRNIESIRTLLSIAIMDGEHLGDSWMPILQCISQLGRLLFFASGVDSDDNFLNSGKMQSTRSIQSTETRETEEINGRVVLEAINEILIEKVFSSTTKLSDAGILNMIDCLVHVSISEIEGDSKKAISGVGRSVRSIKTEDKEDKSNSGEGPRVYSLQKLVEVADYNMNKRSRLSWAKIWEVMANHFVVIGCHENANVSMFAIDALRQLSFKFLEKPELADFNFQRLFLQPFLSIMENPNSRADTRELILQCVDNTVRSSSFTIRSGWKIFFAILSISANDVSERNCYLGLSVLQYLVDSSLDDFCSGNKMNTDGSNDDGKEDTSQDYQLSAAEAKEQSTLAEDFIGLCGASLAFVESKKELDMALSMRALCHIACYADKIAEGKALPPHYNSQTSDKDLPGYTYEGLNEEEERQMILWRPIFDGLANGISSKVTSNSSAVGCFVQRGSAISLRSILLRYGTLFSANELKAIMKYSIIPAIETAAKNDTSPVLKIISESPTVSNLDFLNEPLPFPPPVDDEGLLRFAKESKLDDSHNTSKRAMGVAELLVEASFVDLKHGGSGNLSQAYTLLQKAPIQKNIDEPFPESWVATTAPIMLGMLTDMFCLIATNYSSSEAKELWQVTVGEMQKWAIGTPFAVSSSPSLSWKPSEALVRIGCKEIEHFSKKLISLFPSMKKGDVAMWLSFLCQNLAETLEYNVQLEQELHENVSKEIADMDRVKEEEKSAKAIRIVETPYGKGVIVGSRQDTYNDDVIDISIIELESGATLYGHMSADANEHSTEYHKVEVESKDSARKSKAKKIELMRKYISPLRVRCTSVYCLQNSFYHFLDLFSVHCGQADISRLLESVEKSRSAAEKASIDKSLSTYFVEAMKLEWGDRVEEPQAAFTSDSGVGHLGRCEMFFLTQEASANSILIRLLSILFSETENKEWDTVRFAEPLLMSRMKDVLQKFIISERENGHKLDQNVWRTVKESGTKYAIHCTSFAAVVVNILSTILGFTNEQFQRQKTTLFPVLCSLISAQSEEIRMLVAQVLKEKVASLLDIPAEAFVDL